jgi:hypothetical protein
MEYGYDELKDSIKDAEFRKSFSFEILRAASDLCNQHESLDYGRDLIIRMLEYRSDFNSSVLNALLRKVGLFPYIKDHTEDQALDFFDSLAFELHKPHDGNIVFHSLQAKVFSKLINGENVVLSAPTSFGKSILIDSLIESRSFNRVVIILPTLALIDETRQRITEKFTDDVKVITHSSQKELEGNCSINIYALTQERALEIGTIDSIDLLVVDEFYKIDPKYEESDERALILNYAFHKLVKRSKQFYLLGPNIEDVKGLNFYSKDFHFIPTKFSTVAADIFHHNYKKNDPKKNSTLLELVYRNDDSKIVYCQSPNSASDVAKILVANNGFPVTDEIDEAIDWISSNFSAHWVVSTALRKGIGLHHGGVPRALQQWMIKAFNEGLLKVLVCTSTIIEGVNTVAKNVIVYDRRKSTTTLDFFSFKNILGRAGRMGEHFVGECHILEVAPKEEFFDVAFPIEFPDQYQRPSWYLLFDDDDPKPEIPDGRFSDALNNGILSQEFLKKNLPLDIDGQIKLAKDLIDNHGYDMGCIFEGEYPSYSEKEIIFRLCYSSFLSHYLKQYEVFNHIQLLTKVEAIIKSPDLASYLSDRTKARDGDKSLVIENELRFIRNVVCFSLPRALKALINISYEVFAGIVETDALEFYALNLENMGIQPAFFSLEEFGIPYQLAKKISRKYDQKNQDETPNIETAISFVKNITQSNFVAQLSPFEVRLLANFERTVR